jgi:hypothetical protein
VVKAGAEFGIGERGQHAIGTTEERHYFDSEDAAHIGPERKELGVAGVRAAAFSNAPSAAPLTSNSCEEHAPMLRAVRLWAPLWQVPSTTEITRRQAGESWKE